MNDFLTGLLVIFSFWSAAWHIELVNRTKILATDMVLVKELLKVEKKLAPTHDAQAYFKENSI